MNKRTNLVISSLGLFLLAIGILCATVFKEENINNLIFGTVVAVLGIATVIIYLPLALRGEGK